MAARWILPLGALLASGCTTISLSRMDRCVVQKTDHAFGDTKHEILFCDPEAPKWSADRSVRLAQECLYHDAISRRDQLLLAHRNGQSPPAEFKDTGVFNQCYPEAIRTVQGENDLLKDRAARTDEARQRAEASHAKLEEGLTRALDRPINAVADAKATSDSGSDVKHRAEVAHSDLEHRAPGEQVTHVEVVAPAAPTKPRPVAKKKAAPAPKPATICDTPCPTPEPAAK